MVTSQNRSLCLTLLLTLLTTVAYLHKLLLPVEVVVTTCHQPLRIELLAELCISIIAGKLVCGNLVILNCTSYTTMPARYDVCCGFFMPLMLSHEVTHQTMRLHFNMQHYTFVLDDCGCNTESHTCDQSANDMLQALIASLSAPLDLEPSACSRQCCCLLLHYTSCLIRKIMIEGAHLQFLQLTACSCQALGQQQLICKAACMLWFALADIVQASIYSDMWACVHT